MLAGKIDVQFRVTGSKGLLLDALAVDPLPVADDGTPQSQQKGRRVSLRSEEERKGGSKSCDGVSRETMGRS